VVPAARNLKKKKKKKKKTAGERTKTFFVWQREEKELLA